MAVKITLSTPATGKRFVVKPILRAPKSGDYFKAIYDGVNIVGRVTTQKPFYEDEKIGLALVFNIPGDDDGYCSGYIDDDYGFGSDCDIDDSDLKDFTLISAKEFSKLVENVMYEGWNGEYKIKITKGITKDKDFIKFGCGDVALRRSQLETIYNSLKELDDSELDILATVFENHSLCSNQVASLKDILNHVV